MRYKVVTDYIVAFSVNAATLAFSPARVFYFSMMNKVTRINLRVSEQEAQKLHELAKDRGVTLSAMVLGLCRAELRGAGYEVAEEERTWRRKGTPAPEKPKRPRGRPRKVQP